MWKADGWLLEVLDEAFSSKWLADPTCDPSDDDRVDPIALQNIGHSWWTR